jgi:hypothetical protein
MSLKRLLYQGDVRQQSPYMHNPLLVSIPQGDRTIIVVLVDRNTEPTDLDIARVLMEFVPLSKTMAEGVGSEPFFPSGDQGHKMGFATPLNRFS